MYLVYIILLNLISLEVPRNTHVKIVLVNQTFTMYDTRLLMNINQRNNQLRPLDYVVYYILAEMPALPGILQ